MPQTVDHIVQLFTDRYSRAELIEEAERLAEEKNSTTIYADREGGLLGHVIAINLPSVLDPESIFSDDGSEYALERKHDLVDGQAEAIARLMVHYRFPDYYCPRRMGMREMLSLYKHVASLSKRLGFHKADDVIQDALMKEASDPAYKAHEHINELVEAAAFEPLTRK